MYTVNFALSGNSHGPCNFLLEHQIVTPFQSGFKSGDSTVNYPVGTGRRFNVEAWLKFRRDVVSTLIQR